VKQPKSPKLEKASQALKNALLKGSLLTQKEALAVFPVDVLVTLYNLLHGCNIEGYELKEVRA
jgi:hypothetical protein